ncbi:MULTISPECIES: glycoside hydrolase family 3 protein [Enorma]|uniref:glycoside hydrolase family 3 protein n=1 Tax=Enorma TaxID=1472762 RepID=UPI000367EB8F|nr:MULTISPECIES: glycoside hydrolase family 3 N-terminal domain-containing protein [Enorma]
MRPTSVSRRAALAALGCAAGSLAGLAACDAPAPGGDGQAGSAGSGAAGGQGSARDEPVDAVNALLASMTLEQKVAQLFMVTPEQLTGVSTATVAGELTERALAELPVGGLAYFSKNLQGADQVRALLDGTDRLARGAGAGVPPLLGVDEEGGSLVARVANSGLFDVERFPDMAEIGATGDAARAAEVGRAIGTYLREIGFNLDFAPVADVLTNPDNTAIGARSFGSDPDLVAEMVAAEVAAMLDAGILPCAKHFPGHGDTAGDSHTGAVYAERTRAEIEACELAPFRAAIEAGCPLVMVGHIETPNFAGDGLPASLSPTMMGDVLRGELGFEGVIVSDAFDMGAITERFAPGEAAARFFAAGGDLLLMPSDLHLAYQGVLDAVRTGSLSGERVDESVRRILAAKRRAGLLP